MEKVDSLTAELDAVGEIVRGWIQGGTPPDAIAVLVHDRYQRQRVAGALTQAGLPAREIDRDRPVPDRVSVLTMHRAKGTEFSKVVLAGVGWTSDAEQRRLAALDLAERHDADLRARSLVYVAATRARDELAVVSPARVTAAVGLSRTMRRVGRRVAPWPVPKPEQRAFVDILLCGRHNCGHDFC